MTRDTTATDGGTTTQNVILENRTEQEKSVDVSVSHSDETVFHNSYDLSPTGRKELHVKIEGPGEYRCRIGADGVSVAQTLAITEYGIQADLAIIVEITAESVNIRQET